MFVKIFLSFWLTVGLFAAAEEVAARLAHNEEQRTLATQRSVVDDARTVAAEYERRGTAGARSAAAAFEGRRGLFADLLDARRASLTGQPVRPAETQLARLADRLAAAGLPDAAASGAEGLAAQQIVTGTGERVTLVVGLPRNVTTVVSRALLVSSPVRLAFILAIGGVVCFVVARHLSRPIAQLSAAANALANGRLQTRVGRPVATRHDEVGALARDFDRMAERIEALVAGQRRLLGDVSHELRSPLARLAVALGLARQGATAEAAEYFSRIDRETGRLDRLIEQLLTLARIESGVDAELLGRFDLVEIVQEVVGDGDFEARAGGKQVRLVAADAVTLIGMGDLMRSAIENVVRNAIRHTDRGTTVDVALRCPDGATASATASASLTVRDRGRGVPESMVGEMFRPFWRAPSAADQPSEGAGLGLAIAERVVRMHGGTIRAANAADGGLIVTIDLRP